jgi:alpha-mannosidase
MPLDFTRRSRYREDFGNQTLASRRRLKSFFAMTFDRLTVLLPCHSLEDLSLERSAEESEELLSAWSALYHPALLLHARALPHWVQADSPPDDPAASLTVLPRPAESQLPAGWLDQALAAGAAVVRNQTGREAMVADALARLPGEPPRFDAELVGDFLALGFCHFQVELLTRRLRYMSNLDESRFQERTLAAAQEAADGREEAAREQLHSAFDLLTEAREYFYPVETYLLDLTLVAPTTIGPSLRAELARGGPLNLLLSGETVQRMAQREPQTLAALREGLEKEQVTIIGGEYDERELPLLTHEAILDHLGRGLDVYQEHLGRRPEVFGRRRFGLTPLLPGVLRRLGFLGCLHFTLDDGRFPTGNQSRIHWEGPDGEAIEALARLPLDASKVENFLQLPEKLGRAMDVDHSASAVFAHWPGQASPWYRDLQRMARYAPALGRFASAADCLRRTEYAGQPTRYKADQYRSAYLRQAVEAGQADPISRWTRYYHRLARVETANRLQFLADAVGNRADPSPPLPPGEGRGDGIGDERTNLDAKRPAWPPGLTDLLPLAQAAAPALAQAAAPACEALPAGIDESLAAATQEALARFSQSLARQDQASGYTLANPNTSPRRVVLDAADLAGLPAVGGAVLAAQEAAGRKQVLVEVPPLGFAWIAAASPAVPATRATKKTSFWSRPKKDEDPRLVTGNVLRNEFLEMAVDPVTGGIKAIRAAGHRENRLGQQIALRTAPAKAGGGTAKKGHETEYTVMAADKISVIWPGPLAGKVASRGRLMDREGRIVARFVETVTLRRGSRLIEVEIELQTDHQPGPDPWESYFAARFAWGDDTAELVRGVGFTEEVTESTFLEAPQFVDLRQNNAHTTIFTAGLPYHRRFGPHKLDTLLLVRGETSRKFRLGIGLDLPHPAPVAMEFLTPDLIRPQSPPPSSPFGWLFHLDAKNVIATHWEMLVGPACRAGPGSECGDSVPPSPARQAGPTPQAGPTAQAGPAGFRVRLLETEGRGCRVGLRSFRAPAAARLLDASGAATATLEVVGDRITAEIPAYGWIEIEAEYA